MKCWLLISCGEPFGISYELTLKALKLLQRYRFFLPVLIGSKEMLKYTATKYAISFNPIVISEKLLHNICNINLPVDSYIVVDIPTRGKVSFRRSGEIAFYTLEKLVEIIKNFLERQKEFAVLTMPVSKLNISKFCPNFVGHTEYFAEKFNVPKQKISMLMEGKDKEGNLYKVLMLTRHIPLKEVSKNISVESVVNQVLNVVDFVNKYEKIKFNEILICNLNPHGGEEGYISDEENTILKQAARMVRRITNKKVIFPIQSADAFIYAKNNKDVLIVTTYHDQAMIPLKLLCKYSIVNITVGLPFLRISPGHGTATDIYLQNKADISAVKFCLEKLEEFMCYVKN